MTGYPKRMNRISNAVNTLYLWAMFLGLPLVMHRGYFDITEAKTVFFVICSAVFLVARGVIAVQRGKPFGFAGVSAGLALAFALICLFSTAFSGRLADVFLGRRARWQGLGMMLLYALLYVFFPREEIRREDALRPLFAGLAVTAALAVLNHQGADPLGVMRRLVEFDRGRYISTLGNINFAGAYFSLVLPPAVWFALGCERRRSAVLWIIVFLGLWAAVAVRSESTILGLGTALLVMPLLARSRPEILRRLPALYLALPLWLQLYGLLCRSRGIFLSALTRAILSPWVCAVWVLAAVGALLWSRRKSDGSLQKGAAVYGWGLLAAAAAAVIGLVLLNTVWKAAPLGGAEDWLRFTDSWGTDRGGIWRYCLGLFGDYPLLEKLFGGGAGILALMDARHPYFPDAILDTAHSEYLQILMNWGLLGLAAYLGWLIAAGKGMFNRQGDLSRAALAGLIGYGAQAIVNIAQTPGVALLFVLIAAAPLSEREIAGRRVMK